MSDSIADVVIVGAGMAGVAAAHQLAVRLGRSRITLIDLREPLSLTSSKGTEAYRNYWPGPDDTMARFMNRSIDLLEALDTESAGAFELIAGAMRFSPPTPMKRRSFAGTRARPRNSSRAIEPSSHAIRSSPTAWWPCSMSIARAT